jgi:trehalose-6-phosphate synthase/Kef-type K+ transport system membrane component KefB
VRRAFALAVAVLAVIWVQWSGGPDPSGSAATALALGFTLLGGALVGDVLGRFHLPRLTGYLLFGAVTGPYLGNVITESMAGQLQIVTGVATTLIALVAGLTLSVDRLGARLRAITGFATVTLAVLVTGLAAAAWLAWPWLPIAPDAGPMARLAMVALLAVMTASFSPTMTAAVITETGARGRLSELVLAVVVIADLVLLVAFSLALAFARHETAAVNDTGIFARLLWEIGGAVAVGVFVGALFALYLRYAGREVPLVLLAVCALLTQVGSTQQFEPLLAAVAAGLVIENLSVAQGEALRAAVTRGATPVLIIFFAAVGASLQLNAVATLGGVALAAAALRLGLVRLGTVAGLRISRLDRASGGYAWTGLISQAGITLGFASVVSAEFPGWGQQMQTLIVALIAINELAGPILLRHGLTQAGDLATSPPRPLVVVSNREPYLHRRTPDGGIAATAATGGVAVALDALMRERGGVWIAHGAGDADRLVVDAGDVVRVPPQQPAYDLRRLWIEEPLFSKYYGGFANEGLWPLCHQVDVRPQFRSDDWQAYRAVNARFAETIDDELVADGPVFIQDYHLAMVAPELRARRPAVRTALFWHIPWPHPDRLRICPWHREIVSGLLSNDLLAFQLERDRLHFLAAAGEDPEADVELEASRVNYRGRHCSVVAVPIGVDYDRIQELAASPDLEAEQCRLRELLGLTAGVVGVGVDRLDYTKGIPERLAAIDRVVRLRPELRGRLTFVQIAVPSRSELDSYSAIEAEVGARVAEINARHAVPGRPPLIRYHTTALSTASLVALYRMADFCIVSSLHDGMNLVAKEYVAARGDDGVLVLSAWAGAAEELTDALIINPYDVDGFAAALVRAIEMPEDERARRMRAMRRIVAGRNVFSWASDILEGLESLWTRPLHYAVRGLEGTSV